MKIFQKTPALSFYLLHTGFSSFKARIKEVLDAQGNANLEDFIDDDSLRSYYRNGESPEFVAASLWNPAFNED